MQTISRFILIAAALHLTPAGAQTVNTVPPPSKRQLIGLTEQEASKLIEKLKQAQSDLKEGKSQTFELVSGSRAFLNEINVTPKDAFLRLPFEKVWEIQRSQSDTKLWQPYRLAYAPNGLGQLYWEVEVVLDFYGQVERITMIYKPPAPF